MQAVYFKENQKNQWNEFIAENCPESFLQSWEWGEFQESLGRRIWRIGIVDNNFSDESKAGKSQISNPKSQTNLKSQIPNPKQIPNSKIQAPITNYKLQITNNLQLPITNYQLLAIALIVKHDLPFGGSYLYCPRGPVIINPKSQIPNPPPEADQPWAGKSQISNYKLPLDLLFDEIKKIAKKEGAMFLRVDPPAGLNNEVGIMNYGYSLNFKKSPNEVQPRDTLVLDLTKSEEELLKEMKQKTRYNIKLAERKGVKVSSIKYQVSSKYQIPNTEQTPNPKFQTPNKFQIPSSKYFDGFWELMEETSRRDKFASHGKDYYWKMLEGLGESEGGIPECRLRARLYLAEYKNKIIAANIVSYFGDLAIYLHGASSNEYRNVMAPYLLQWRQILDAKKAGCKKYDFWGIAPELKVESQKLKVNSKFKIQNSKFQSWGGITRFKKGFGGEEKNYIGAYDAVFDKAGYAVYRFVKSIKY